MDGRGGDLPKSRRADRRRVPLPSLYLLVTWPMRLENVEGIQGLPTPEERLAAYRTLYDHRFPFAARMLAGKCEKALPKSSEEKPPELVGCRTERCPIQKSGTDIEIITDPDAFDALEKAREAREADEARRLSEIAVKREECLDLLRGGEGEGSAAMRWLGGAGPVRHDNRREPG